MTIFVCKMCGRSIRQDEKPNWCYFDRCDSIENISDEDALKMGLDVPEGERFEFPGDVRWDPDSGRPMDAGPGATLREFQRAVMAQVTGFASGGIVPFPSEVAILGPRTL